jgi:hypothetical protein
VVSLEVHQSSGLQKERKETLVSVIKEALTHLMGHCYRTPIFLYSACAGWGTSPLAQREWSAFFSGLHVCFKRSAQNHPLQGVPARLFLMKEFHA